MPGYAFGGADSHRAIDVKKSVERAGVEPAIYPLVPFQLPRLFATLDLSLHFERAGAKERTSFKRTGQPL